MKCLLNEQIYAMLATYHIWMMRIHLSMKKVFSEWVIWPLLPNKIYVNKKLTFPFKVKLKVSNNINTRNITWTIAEVVFYLSVMWSFQKILFLYTKDWRTDILKLIYHTIVVTYTTFQWSSGDNKIGKLLYLDIVMSIVNKSDMLWS